jgi:hypothetical protein
MSEQRSDAVDVLRSIWSASGQDDSAFDETCAPQKTCKNMKEVTFDGFAEPGTDLRTAWRTRLQREGKLGQSGMSIRDLVLDDTAGPAGPVGSASPQSSSDS